MDYFNEDERKKQKEFAAWRDRALNPVIKLFLALRLSPNHITIIAILCLIIGVALPTQFEYWWIISILLFSYCVLDGFDGPLARRIGKAHEGGAMVDMAADQIGVPLVAAAGAWHWGVDPWSAVVFSASYISFIMLAVYANQHQIQLWTFLRVKYFYYFLYCSSALIQYEILVYATPVFAIYYSFFCIHALQRIYKHFDQLHEASKPENSLEGITK
ncbi:CDP-alcohol phosphatidyltransferase family protein [Curvivirga aplysinae]|uniref:CDP-alcohol phosphatidyltransferase family protein n=1 Tax=Curvivirga aplysinae TaxID=2529852 RepID=UPI0012BC5C10|nr:CDP-alcohol phosphatidyltransferase family protein [Curvivirga aplysinae]MTI10489.1 CDP-alcohol phosphatidyltransferase family protein [Curvivirga aplysinae]